MPNIRLHDEVFIINPQVFVRCEYKGKLVDGAERVLITKSEPSLTGQIGIVMGSSYVKTGIWRSGHTVDDMKFAARLYPYLSHRILRVAISFKGKHLGEIKIEVNNVERNMPERQISIWDGLPRRG